MSNLSDIIREIGELGCSSPRIQSDIKGFVNRVQKRIAERRNWGWMHDVRDVTILAASNSATLPVTFKELAPEKSPVTYTAPQAQFPVPVTVKSRAQCERERPGAYWFTGNLSTYWSPFTVFMEQRAGLWTINTPAQFPHATDAIYTVSAYWFPDDLALGTDHNAITDSGELAQALIDGVRATAWLSEDSTDAKGIAAMQLYENAIKSAMFADARQNLAGRSIHL